MSTSRVSFASYNARKHSSQYSRSAPKPFKERKASKYEPLATVQFDRTTYPALVPSIALPLIDPSHGQALFANGGNFAFSTSCQVFLLDVEGKSIWKEFKDAETLLQQVNQRNRLQVLFLSLEEAHSTTYGCQLSLERSAAIDLFQVLNINPHFCDLTLGKPDYWAPVNTQQTGAEGYLEQLEFACQFPRWYIHTKQQPCSVYVSFDSRSSSTTCIIVSGKSEAFVDRTKKRLNDFFVGEQILPQAVSQAADPFLVPSILCHESLLDAADTTRINVRHKLYDQLDVVDTYAKQPFDRASLRALTNNLHQVSQDADSLYASAEMLLMVSEHVLRARHRAAAAMPSLPMQNGVSDGLNYCLESCEAQKRWIQSYKLRKDTAMNLLYNLVQQQDMETNINIAQDTRDDSSSMRVITILTMVFLPPTAVAGFFGMTFFELSESTGKWRVSPMIWLFIAITVPMLVITLSLYLCWHQITHNIVSTFDGFVRKITWKGKIGSGRQRMSEADPELGGTNELSEMQEIAPQHSLISDGMVYASPTVTNVQANGALKGPGRGR